MCAGTPQLRKARRSLKSIFRVIFHSLGLSCIGASIILQLIVLIDIMWKGYFLGTEENPIILSVEMFLTVFALTYFLLLVIRIGKGPSGEASKIRTVADGGQMNMETSPSSYGKVVSQTLNVAEWKMSN